MSLHSLAARAGRGILKHPHRSEPFKTPGFRPGLFRHHSQQMQIQATSAICSVDLELLTCLYPSRSLGLLTCKVEQKFPPSRAS